MCLEMGVLFHITSSGACIKMTFSERERLIFHIAGLVIAHASNKWDLSFCPRCEKGKLFRDEERDDVFCGKCGLSVTAIKDLLDMSQKKRRTNLSEKTIEELCLEMEHELHLVSGTKQSLSDTKYKQWHKKREFSENVKEHWK